MWKFLWVSLMVIFVVLAAGAGGVFYFINRTANCEQTGDGTPAEVDITPILLADPLDRASAELSGMDWYGDYLILLPQYFDFAVGRMLYAIPKADILAYLEDPAGSPLQAIRIPVDDERLERILSRSFEGYESIAFSGDKVYLTIETSTQRQMQGYLVSGEIAPDLSGMTLDVETTQPIPLPQQIFNTADEAILVAGDRVLTFFEANGKVANPNPVARVYSTTDLTPAGSLPFPTIEYRITDATRLADDNTFWVINFYSLGSFGLKLRPDDIAKTFGEGCTHAFYFTVERLVEMKYDPQTGISLTDTPPIQLELQGDLKFRNWEGIVRLDDKGFLIATDKYPGTILAFVPYPEVPP